MPDNKSTGETKNKTDKKGGVREGGKGRGKGGPIPVNLHFYILIGKLAKSEDT